MSARQKMWGLLFLVAALAVALVVVRRMSSPTGETGGGVTALPPEEDRPPRGSRPTPSPPGSARPSSPSSEIATGPDDRNTSGGGGVRGEGDAANATDGAAPAATPPPQFEYPLQLRFEAGVRLWIRVQAIQRSLDGRFTFRGTLLQPALAGTIQLEQNTEVSGYGTVNQGQVTMSVTRFRIKGQYYALQSASGSIKPPGAGPAVEITRDRLFEMWFGSSSVYRKATGIEN
ncbi:MAG TPA: hypothetical protein VN946_02340 [Terriglobales bacterium]|jgi:hypothetical protein|nr:hypothetical protein [Terriglobales bacterium]